MALGKKFILKDLDDTHLFILEEVVKTLQERVGESTLDPSSWPGDDAELVAASQEGKSASLSSESVSETVI
ncbi:hypothetical protein NQZ68_005143 [Dissostichus eleginoides]|nr:hypothetical protein NQZ68_005143 [Dissostichus eleginoides]